MSMRNEEGNFGDYADWSLPLVEVKICEIENELSMLEDIYIKMANQRC